MFNYHYGKTGTVIDEIRAGDRVTVKTRHGQERRGKAVMRGGAGHWVLNGGGAHGTPVIATADNVVKINGKAVAA